MFARLAVLGSLVTVMTTTAHAEPVDLADSVELHVNGGFEITGGAGAIAAGARGRVGVGKAFGSGAVRPSVTLGAVFGAGSIVVDDPRALDGGLAIGYRSYGPEAQVALRFVDGGKVDTRLFASFALLKVDLDERLMYDAVPGIGGNAGLRGSLGINWADRAARLSVSEDGNTRHSSLNLAIVFLPQQAEIVWERDAGSDRYGVMFAWGI